MTAPLPRDKTTSWASSHPGALGLIVIAAFVVICAGVKAAEPILTPVVFGVYLAIVATPLVKWLQTHHCPLSLAVLVALVGDTVVLAGFVALLAVSTSELYEELPKYVSLLQARADNVALWLSEHGAPTKASELFDARATVGMIASLLGNLADVVWTLTIALIVAFFLLLRFGGLQGTSPTASFIGSERVARTFKEVNRYIAVKTATSMATGLLVGWWIWLLGGELPALFGLVAFLLNYIPNLGSIIAAIPAIVLGYLSGGLGHSVMLMVGYVCINVGIGNILEPRVMGRALGLWPLVTLLSVFFWGWLLGTIGALLSALLTVMLKMVLLTLNDLRPLGMMLGPVPRFTEVAPTGDAILEGTLPQTGADG